MTEQLLGRPLGDVLPILRAQGIEPTVIVTAAPGREERQGTPRVVRIRGNEVTVAVFQDATPE